MFAGLTNYGRHTGPVITQSEFHKFLIGKVLKGRLRMIILFVCNGLGLHRTGIKHKNLKALGRFRLLLCKDKILKAGLAHFVLTLLDCHIGFKSHSCNGLHILR